MESKHKNKQLNKKDFIRNWLELGVDLVVKVGRRIPSFSFKRNRYQIRKILVRAVTAIFIVAVIGTPTLMAMAASEQFYPSYCLGGWQNPQLAAGQPNLETGADPSQFNNDNSAVLSGSSAQIFCGYFLAPEQTNQPTRVQLSFSWLVRFPTKANLAGYNTSGDAVPVTPPVINNPPSTTSEPSTNINTPINSSSSDNSNTNTSVQPQSWWHVLGTPAFAQEIAPVDNTAPTPEPITQQTTDTNTPTPPATPPVNDTNTNLPVPLPTSAEPINENVNLPPVVEPVLTNQPVDQPSVPPVVNEPAPTPAPAIIPPADGQNSGFIDISFSLNGTDWRSLGSISATQWSNFSTDIPISSWQDLNKLQLSFSTHPTFDTQPTIFLDGIIMKVDYDKTVGEVVNDVGNSIVDALSGVVNTAADAVQAVANTVANVITPEATPPETNANTNLNTNVVIPPPPPQMIKVTEKVFTYAVVGEPQATEKNMPWFTRDDINALGGDKALTSTVTTPPSINISADGKSMVVSGQCNKTYGVLLLYHKADDYLKDPSSFVANRNTLCVNNSFAFDFKDLVEDVLPGSYYLLLAEQGIKKTWLPVSGVVPVTINMTLEEKEVPAPGTNTNVPAVVNVNAP